MLTSCVATAWVPAFALVTWSSGFRWLNPQPTDEEWKNSIKVIKHIYKLAEEKNIIFSIIFDLRLMGILSFEKINEWGNLFIEYKDKTKKYVKCTSVITDSFIIKNTLNLFFNIYTTVKPMRIVNNLDESYDFIDNL